MTLIAGIAIPAVTAPRAKSRDATRVAHIDTILSAATAYRLENGRFPCSSPKNSTENDFLGELVSGGFLKETPRDPTNNNTYQYRYSTFRNSPGGSCGQLLHIDVTFERPSQCPHGRFANGGSFGSGRCNIFYPRPPATNPATCPDPWHFTPPVEPPNCGTIAD